ncbi:pollen-specific protein C13-like [Impatiens glandulifera]|uniref:pollen-specific protein C13-like n=1 Tax=Impatiens glandulifera TaxID=253017 RepID=UPI001FB0B1C5|nr:pollen-specific protein C13-like [Impatiens glandulifera]
MARTMLMIALCLLPAIVTATRPMVEPLSLEGRVYCDTCRAGFETSATTYISGAKVRIECRDKISQKVVYSVETTTDETGTYRVNIKEDHEDGVCDALLVSSSHRGCTTADPGRDRARVILTRYNGIASSKRYANNMGFMMNEPMSGCTQLLQQYQEIDD